MIADRFSRRIALFAGVLLLSTGSLACSGSPAPDSDVTGAGGSGGSGGASCAAIGVGSGDISFSTFEASQSQLVRLPHVTHGASGWFVFYTADDAVALALGDDAKPKGTPVPVPGTMAAATTSGFAIASTLNFAPDATSTVFRLGPDLATLAGPIEIADSPNHALESGRADARRRFEHHSSNGHCAA